MNRRRDAGKSTTGRGGYGSPMVSFALLLLGAYLILGDRVELGLGDASFPVLLVGFVGVAVPVSLVWRPVWVRTPGVKLFETVGLPLIVLLAVLPVFGVLFGDYAPSSLLSWLVPLFPVAVWMICNAAIAARRQRFLLSVCASAIIAHGIFGLAQYLRRTGMLPAQVSQALLQWDIAAQMRKDAAYVIVGRSTGLFINANVFGAWSAFAVVFGFRFFKGAPRVVLMGFGFLGILVSQSRTALVMGLVILVVGCLKVLSSRSRLMRAGLIMAVGLPGLALVVALVVRGGGFQVEESALARLSSAWRVLSGGVEEDANLAGRFNAWEAAFRFVFIDGHPFGTWGPPQVLFESYIDNQFVSFLLQGSLPLVIAYCGLLLVPFSAGVRSIQESSVLRLLAVLLCVASMTLIIVETVAGAALVWVSAALIVHQAQYSETCRKVREVDSPHLS